MEPWSTEGVDTLLSSDFEHVSSTNYLTGFKGVQRKIRTNILLGSEVRFGSEQVAGERFSDVLHPTLRHQSQVHRGKRRVHRSDQVGGCLYGPVNDTLSVETSRHRSFFVTRRDCIGRPPDRPRRTRRKRDERGERG